MADEGDSGEKTERPTGRRISQARRQGTVARSVELSQVIAMIAAFIAIQYIAPILWRDIVMIIRGGLSGDHNSQEFTLQYLQLNFYNLLRLFLPTILLLLLITATAGGLTTALQTKFLWSTKLLRPKLSNLNPIRGIRRLFSLQNSVNLLKSFAKLAIILPIAYYAFFEIFPQLFSLMQTPINYILPFMGTAAALIFWRIMRLMIVLAIIDYFWQRYSVGKRLKMSKQEVKDERKAIEGDEATKRQIIARGLQRARQRMMLAVPTADVVVTNPTHIAIALKYDVAMGKAPRVIAKGRGYVAERIKEIAREHRVPVIERKPLARALFASVEVNQEIPYELYTAVADLLAYVYKLTGRNPFRKSAKQRPAHSV